MLQPTLSRHTRRIIERGFTLVELLIVIAIMAILSTILFPVFSRVRENTRRASCQSNLKQIGLGILQYTQDYDDKYPVLFQIEADGSFLYWGQTVQPYLKGVQVLFCPSNKHGQEIAENQSSRFPKVPVGYAQNPRYSSISSSTIDESSRKILIGERSSSSMSGGFAWSDWGNRGSTAFQNQGFAGHFANSNYLFGDGHVKALRPLQTVSDGYNMWGEFDSNRGSFACPIHGINCDITTPELTDNLGAWELANG